MKLLDTVAFVEDIPALNLYRGQIGTIVEEYEQGYLKLNLVISKVRRML